MKTSNIDKLSECKKMNKPETLRIMTEKLNDVSLQILYIQKFVQIIDIFNASFINCKIIFIDLSFNI